MRIRRVIASLLIGLLGSATVSFAQNAARASRPCPGEVVSAEIDPVFVGTTLDQLVRASELIVVGTVVNVLPPIRVNPDVEISIETHSLVAVDQLLYGTLPPGVRTILLAQQGGEIGACKLEVPADPVVSLREQYVLFLRADDRAKLPNISGSPRYIVVGVWTGKVKIADGKIQFAANATPRFRGYNNISASGFIDTLKQSISRAFPKN